MPNMGEYVVGAHLTMREKCQGVIYNIRPPNWSYHELDVLGLRLSTRTAFLCEVTTHIDGLVIGSGAQQTFDKLSTKFDMQRAYAQEYLSGFDVKFMLWSPLVRPKLKIMLDELVGLDLVVNERYTRYVNQLRSDAKATSKTTGNEFFRCLQILEHMVDD